MIQVVDIATARAATGVRMAVSGLVPSPWSEAAKGLFRVAKVPVLMVRRMRDGAEVTAWTGVDNVPAVMCDQEPVRAHWAAITELASRLAGPDVLLPSGIAARAEQIGLLDVIAGEDGIGWNGRLAMLHVSFETEGKRGFPPPVAQFLATRYGYSPAAFAVASTRIQQQLTLFAERLANQKALGHEYLNGPNVSALDVYLATFLTPLSGVSETECLDIHPSLRQAFATATDVFGNLVPAELSAHRRMMFERHLTYPITL